MNLPHVSAVDLLERDLGEGTRTDFTLGFSGTGNTGAVMYGIINSEV